MSAPADDPARSAAAAEANKLALEAGEGFRARLREAGVPEAGVRDLDSIAAQVFAVAGSGLSLAKTVAGRTGAKLLADYLSSVLARADCVACDCPECRRAKQ